ncbi:MAG: DUF1302 family protein [Thermodesulfobacteriota bacterium]|nr:DUF1302 family protein [Thermodesulfobacteriota bacterium]
MLSINKKLFLLFILTIICSSPVFARDGGWKISGYIKNASSLRISEDNKNVLLKFENILELEPHYRVNRNIEFHGIVRAYYDAVFDLEGSGWTSGFRFEEEIREANSDSISDPLRELYADITIGRVFMRLGKQQVGWGEAIGMKMLDVINPQDMREFNQLDFEDSHIPLWMANVIYYPPVMGTSLQLLLIPDIEPHYIPPAGYPFTPQFVNRYQGLESHGVLHLNRSPNAGKRVPQNLKNMEIGVRWYQNLPYLEYSLNYFYHWSDVPGLYTAYPLYNIDLSMNYDLKYHRFHTLGGSFTRIFDSFFGIEGVSLKGEVAVHLEDRVSYAYTRAFSDFSNPFGIKMSRSDSFNYYLALDKFFFTDYHVLLQFFQFISLDHEDGYLIDEVDSVFSLYLSTDYLQERILPDLLWVYSDDGSLWFRGRCILKITDYWSLNTGCNLYFEHPYSDQDNVFLEVKYEF